MNSWSAYATISSGAYTTFHSNAFNFQFGLSPAPGDVIMVAVDLTGGHIILELHNPAPALVGTEQQGAGRTSGQPPEIADEDLPQNDLLAWQHWFQARGR